MSKAMNVLVEGMNKTREGMVELIKHDLNEENNGKIGGMLINAYNAWQEAERDGVDYIFDIFKQEDLKTAVDCGMTAYEIHTLVGDTTHCLGLFFFGQNYSHPTPIEDVKTLLLANIYEVVDFTLHYPYCDGCKELYEYYLTTNFGC